MGFKADIVKAYSTRDIEEKVSLAMAKYADLMPSSKAARILLKPNMNSNMNALTGNTTDLRIVAAVIKFLKGRGYTNITLGEGTNSGFYRNNISVISRLAFDKLAEYLNVKVVDLNYSDRFEIEFENGVKATVARECIEADFLINMPKLKTHFEAGMSVCLKNLMGCLVGQENKKKTHKSLARNILNINKHIKPHLHIVDGLFAMEGLGPTRGTPVRTGIIIFGTDPYLIDLICSKVAGFDYKKVKTLRCAEERGILTGDYQRYVDSLELSDAARDFKEPKANPLVSFIHGPRYQKYFLAIRNTPFFNYLSSTKFFGNILFLTGLRQDNFIKEEMRFEGFAFNKGKCLSGCTRCSDYCPIGLKLPQVIEDSNNGCIGCQYCFFVCPTKAIEFKGILGFLSEQIRQYDKIVRDIA
jgi:uncharacterized protein (DUF362 family)/ferredoxin